MSVAGKARSATGLQTVLIDHQNDLQLLHSMIRDRETFAIESRPTGTAAGSTPTAAGGFLRSEGDTMIGPLAFYPDTQSIDTTDDSIDISKEFNVSYTSRVIVSTAGGATQLVWIHGAAFAGQILIIQGVLTETFNIIDSTGNIRTFDGNNVTITGNQNLILIFDSVANEWAVVGGSASGLSEPVIHSMKNYGSVDSPVTTNQTLDLSLTTGNAHRIYLGANIDVTFDNPPGVDKLQPFEIIFVQDSTGSRTPTFTDTIIGATGIDEDPNAISIKVVQTFDNGNTYYMYDATGGTGGGGGGNDNLGNHTATQDLVMSSFDITSLDRLRLTSDSGIPASSGDPSIFLDASGDMIFNVASGDIFAKKVNDVLIGSWGDGQSSLYNNNGVMTLDLINRDSTPIDLDQVGELRFIADDDGAMENLITYARLLGVMEDVSAGDPDGSLTLQALEAGILTDYVELNVGISNKTIFKKDIGLDDNSLFFDVDRDSRVYSATDDTLTWELGGTIFLAQTLTGIQQLVPLLIQNDSGVSQLELYNNDNTPIDLDQAAEIKFLGNSDTPTERTYARLLAVMNDVSNGTEEADFYLQAITSGTLEDYIGLNIGRSGNINIFKDIDMDGNNLIMDSDGDSRMVFTTDDVFILELDGGTEFAVTTLAVGIENKYLEIKEMTAPGAAAANSIRLYAKDDGGISGLFWKDDNGTEYDLTAASSVQKLITEGDSKVEVNDSGTGTVDIFVDDLATRKYFFDASKLDLGGLTLANVDVIEGDTTTNLLTSLSTGWEITVGATGVISLKYDTNVKWQFDDDLAIFTEDLRFNDEKGIRANTSSFMYYTVGGVEPGTMSDAANVGAIQGPYKADTTDNPSSSTLNNWFGDLNGCFGFQYDSDGPETYRLWAKLNGTWHKVVMT